MASSPQSLSPGWSSGRHLFGLLASREVGGVAGVASGLVGMEAGTSAVGARATPVPAVAGGVGEGDEFSQPASNGAGSGGKQRRRNTAQTPTLQRRHGSTATCLPTLPNHSSTDPCLARPSLWQSESERRQARPVRPLCGIADRESQGSAAGSWRMIHLVGVLSSTCRRLLVTDSGLSRTSSGRLRATDHETSLCRPGSRRSVLRPQNATSAGLGRSTQ